MTSKLHKICSRCKKSKPTDDFNKFKLSKDQLQSWCRDCFKSYGKKYYGEKKLVRDHKG